jgi:hypothetical protein
MGEHEEIRKSVVNSLTGNDYLYLDNYMQDLALNVRLYKLMSDKLIYVQDYALSRDICESVSADREGCAENLTRKGELNNAC